MNKHLLLLALTAALGASTVQADTGFYPGLYLGGSFGSSTFNDFDGSDVDAELASLGFTSSSSTDDSDTGWKLFAGYKFMPYLAVEGSYTDLGKASASSVITAPVSGSANVEAEASTWAISALGIWPVAPRFELYGRLGFHFWDADVSGSGTAGSVSESDDGTDLLYGVGANFDITPQLGVRGEWERYELDDSDVDLWSIGLSWGF
jgi:OOP family OmpA-OmpF porin